MDAPIFHQVCRRGDGEPVLAVTADGVLYRSRDGVWQRYDFNAAYAGYHPACVFTAVAYADSVLCIAGVDGEGSPRVFCSLLGDVWEERNLTMLHPGGAVRPTGRPLRILYDDVQAQVFVICDNGQLVTLPDCPKCVKITQACREVVADGRLDGRDIVLALADGGSVRVSVDVAAQPRVSAEFARQQIREDGAWLVDVRSHAAHGRDGLRDSLCVPLDELGDWLCTQDRAHTVIFYCQGGVQADAAAAFAKRRGFGRAYSLDGIDVLFW